MDHIGVLFSVKSLLRPELVARVELVRETHRRIGLVIYYPSRLELERA